MGSWYTQTKRESVGARGRASVAGVAWTCFAGPRPFLVGCGQTRFGPISVHHPEFTRSCPLSVVRGVSGQLPKPNLRCAPGPWYFPTMSANEVLEHVKALPPRERRKFFESVHELETALEAVPGARRCGSAASNFWRQGPTQFGSAGAGTGALLTSNEPLRGHQPAHLVLHQ